jgi:hypothetical protein
MISMTPAKTTQPAHAVGSVSYRTSVSADLRREVSVMCLSS